MRLLAAAVLALLAAAPARADTFGELPFRPVAGVATCVRATGAPGELSRWTKDGIELLRADAGGPVPAGTVPLGGAALSCPVISGHPGGAAIAAVLRRGDVRVALREPGGRFGAPVTLPLVRSGEYEYQTLGAAASPRGDAVVAVLIADPMTRRARMVAYRRTPGGTFGAPEPVASWRGIPFSDALAAGIDGAGRATLAWSRDATSSRSAVEVASAAAGARFGAPSRLGTSQIGSEPSLAVAPDGRALIAYDGEAGGVTIAEREPGAADFGPSTSIGGGGGPTVALAEGGAAIVAWRTSGVTRTGGVQMSSRAAAGPFGTPRDVAPGHRPPRGLGSGSGSVLIGSHGPPQDRPRLAAAIAGPDAALIWADGSDESVTGAAYAAIGALAGGPVARSALSGPVRPAISLAPLALADGRAAVAWADDAVELASFATGQGRLHLALAGAPRSADAPPPSVTVPPLRRRRQYVDDPIVLPVRCSAACDVRATIDARAYPTAKVASRASAGVLTLRMYGLESLSRRTTHVGVTLRYGAPGSRASATLHVNVPVRVVRSPPVPAPVDVRARRSGDDVIVSWRASFAAPRAVFVVLALDRRRLPVASRGIASRGRRSFRVTLRDAAAARTVTVIASGHGDRRDRRKTVRIR